jgi:asparagine synthase (glutamine-hydrolysing)
MFKYIIINFIMCGIFALLNHQSIPNSVIKTQFEKGQRRGPEFSKLDFYSMKLVLGFHRLAINGLNDAANQPIVYNDIILICNGEIYNYKALQKELEDSFEFKTTSACRRP